MFRNRLIPTLVVLAAVFYGGTSTRAVADSHQEEKNAALERAIQEIEAEQALKKTLHKSEKAKVEGKMETALEPMLAAPAEPVEAAVPVYTPKPLKVSPPLIEPAAQEVQPAPSWRFVERIPNSSFLGLSIGFYDVSGSDDNTAGVFNLEWQPGWRIARYIQPILGGFSTHEGSLYGYAGFGVPLKFGQHFVVRPTFSAGAYKESSGVDLGQTLAWRGALELAYEFENHSRLGVEAAIITNGKSSDDTDRFETISIKYSMPLEKFQGFNFGK